MPTDTKIIPSLRPKENTKAFVMIDDRNNHASKIHKMATNIKYFKFLC